MQTQLSLLLFCFFLSAPSFSSSSDPFFSFFYFSLSLFFFYLLLSFCEIWDLGSSISITFQKMRAVFPMISAIQGKTWYKACLKDTMLSWLDAIVTQKPRHIWKCIRDRKCNFSCLLCQQIIRGALSLGRWCIMIIFKLVVPTFPHPIDVETKHLIIPFEHALS